MGKVLDLKLGYSCNNDCVHCVISGERERVLRSGNSCDRSFDEIKNELMDAALRGFNEVVLTGGEPTIRSDFIDVLKFANDLGFDVYLQSNGRKFCDAGFVGSCSEFLSGVMIPIHSCVGEVHDKISGRNGSFDESVLGIKNLVASGVKVGMKVVLSRFNYRELNELLKLSKEFGCFYVNVAFPHINGEVRKSVEEIVVRYFELKTYVEDAIEIAKIEKIDVDFEQILPCCLSKPYEMKYFADLTYRGVLKNCEVSKPESFVVNWEDLRLNSKMKGSVCLSCVFNKMCEGFWKEYVELYGFGEFKAVKFLPSEVRDVVLKKLAMRRRGELK